MPRSLTLIRASSGQNPHDTIAIPTLYLTDTAFAAMVDALAALRQQRDRDREWRHLRTRVTALTRDLDGNTIARTAVRLQHTMQQLDGARTKMDRSEQLQAIDASLRTRTAKALNTSWRKLHSSSRHR